jgi:hypothetical protein
MAEYSQQTKSVCTDTNDPTCRNSQAQFDDLNALDAQVKANGKYDVPPNPPLTQPKQVVIVDGFTSLQGIYTGLFAAAALLIIYGLVAKGHQTR